ncbi:MAG: DNA damage-inducible protein D [Bacteroidota bacterium]
MKKERIEELFLKFEAARYDLNGIECWSARDLQVIFDYTQWRNFTNVIQKASKACENAGISVPDHFAGVSKMVEVGSGAKRKVKDVALTRYACYLIAQNADPEKQEVAFAQTYFAVQTRKQELIEKQLLDIARVESRDKLSESEKRLSEVIYRRGLNSKSFGVIRSKGDQALFGGRTTQEMKAKLGVPTNRPLADFLSNLLIRGKAFAAELTAHNVVENDIMGDQNITEEHVTNNNEVRNILLKRGVKPEELPAGEDVNKVKRRLNKVEKKLLREAKKKKT